MKLFSTFLIAIIGGIIGGIIFMFWLICADWIIGCMNNNLLCL